MIVEARREDDTLSRGVWQHERKTADHNRAIDLIQDALATKSKDLLLAAWLIKVAVAGPGNPLPSEWWYYLGGPMGIIFIALGALLVRSLGVLLTGLCMIGGQLVGSLLLDLVVPAPGTIVVFATVAGTLLTLAAIVLTTLPWPRRTGAPARGRG